MSTCYSIEKAEYRVLKAENEKLRKDNDRLIQAVEELHDVKLEDQLVQLEDENAKLRKIASDIHKALFALDIDHCQACPRDTINGPCTKYMAFGSDECSIEKDMRELGIEVS